MDILLIRHKITKNTNQAHQLLLTGSVNVDNKIIKYPHYQAKSTNFVYVKNPFFFKPNISKHPKSKLNYMYRPHRLGYGTFYESSKKISLNHLNLKLTLQLLKFKTLIL